MRRTAGWIGAAAAAAILVHGTATAQPRAQDVNPAPMVPGTRAGEAPGMSSGPATEGPARTAPAARAEPGGQAQQANPTPMPPGSVAGQAPGMRPTDATQGTQPAPAAGAATPGRAAEGGGAAPAGLESGANSFTAEQARERIAGAGFGDVQQLRLDEQGIWRGRAIRNGQPTGVAMDFRGRIAPTP